MVYNPKIHHRRSIRLKGYDYSLPGLYFITIVVRNRLHLFGSIENEKMILNEAGSMIFEEWQKIPQRFSNTRLHSFQIMPNHFHAILEIISSATTVGSTLVVDPIVVEAQLQEELGQPQGVAPTEDNSTDNISTEDFQKKKVLGDMIGAFESITTVEYIRGVKTKKWPPFDKKLWQRNYWEHIIRNDKEYRRISQYIINNPKKWSEDRLK